MVTFVLLGKYSAESIQQMSPQRTKKAIELIRKNGGEVEQMYATLGRYDLLLIASFPSVDDAMKTSVALSKLTGIGFMTSPAVGVEDFDKMVTGGKPRKGK